MDLSALKNVPLKGREYVLISLVKFPVLGPGSEINHENIKYILTVAPINVVLWFFSSNRENRSKEFDGWID